MKKKDIILNLLLDIISSNFNFFIVI